MMDPTDEMDQVYEAFVHWADVLILSTPIRWGAASSLYFKMVERMNCIQNQETISNKHLLQNTVGGFIITGGQDNIQAVAGQLLGFLQKLECNFPSFPISPILVGGVRKIWNITFATSNIHETYVMELKR
jgi:multimeric flavodoxin WrbA